MTLIKGIIFLLCIGSSIIAQTIEIDPGVLIIKTRSTSGLTTASSSGLNKLNSDNGAKSIHSYTLKTASGIGTFSSQQVMVVNFEPSQDVRTLAKRYSQDSAVLYAEPNYIVEAFDDPKDPHLIHQNYLKDTDLISLFEIPNNNSVIVAIIDSGCDFEHPDFEGRFYLNANDRINDQDEDENGYIDDFRGFDFSGFSKGTHQYNASDSYGHGTQMTGIIAANADNNIGIAGLAPSSKLLVLKFLDANGKGTQFDAAMAIRYAADMGARIINCSWGYHAYNEFLKEAIDYALAKGVIIIAAVGNEGLTSVKYPAAFDGVIGVGSINKEEQRSFFSNRGPEVDFVEYGEETYSTAMNNSYKKGTGTSQAAAIISGIAAKILSFNSAFDSNSVMSKMIASSKDLGTAGKDQSTGYGRIDGKALSRVLGAGKPENNTETKKAKDPRPFYKSNPLFYFTFGWIIELVSLFRL